METSGEKGRRSRSPRAPSLNIKDAIVLARSIQEKAGGIVGRDTFSHLAGVSPGSSGRAFRVAAMRAFGLVDGPDSRLELTPLAQSIVSSVSPDEEREGRRRAFLNVPLFRRIAEEFRGKSLPEEKFLTNHIHRNLAVDPSNSRGWAQAFIESGEQASFFLQIAGRWTIPSELDIDTRLGVLSISDGQKASPELWPSESRNPAGHESRQVDHKATSPGFKMVMGDVRFEGPSDPDEKTKQQVRALITWLNQVYELN